jgi:hypothetical protein
MKLILLLISALSLAANAANIVHDHKFGLLGAAVKDGTYLDESYDDDDDWTVHDFLFGLWWPPRSLVTTDDLVGPRSDGNKVDKYELKLKTGQTLLQTISGLNEGRTYLMRIQVIADPNCECGSLAFGMMTWGIDGLISHGSRTMDNDGGYFKIGQLHSTTFVALSDSARIFVKSDGGNANCRPLIRQVLLHMV